MYAMVTCTDTYIHTYGTVYMPGTSIKVRSMYVGYIHQRYLYTLGLSIHYSYMYVRISYFHYLYTYIQYPIYSYTFISRCPSQGADKIF